MKKTISKLCDLAPEDTELFKKYLRKLYLHTKKANQKKISPQVIQKNFSTSKVSLSLNDSRICWLFMFPNQRIQKRLTLLKTSKSDLQYEEIFDLFAIEDPDRINQFVSNSKITMIPHQSDL